MRENELFNQLFDKETVKNFIEDLTGKVGVDFEIDELSNLRGTKKWFLKILKNSSVKVRDSGYNGCPGLYFNYKDGDYDYEKLIVIKEGSIKDLIGEMKNIDGFDVVYPTAKWGIALFDFPLTPKTHEMVEEFLTASLELYKQWFNQA